MKGIEYKGPRVATGPERSDKEPQLLDTVIVIPAMDEGTNIIDTLESIAVQRKPKNREMVQGIVVVINNRPDASSEVIASNMRTYTLLQGIRHGAKMGVRGDPAFAEKVRRIQESGMTIEVVDAFSEGHAHAESNVGRARKIGTEHALPLVRGERSAIVSTDSDTTLGADTLMAVQRVFDTEPVDATPLELGRRVHDLDDSSRMAYRLYSVYWGLNAAAQNMPHKTQGLREKGMPFSLARPSMISSSAVWLSGGGTAFTAEAYKNSGGYRPIGREEDTLLASDMVNSGARVKDMSRKYAQLMAYTRPRISLRTERGFGHTIADWNKPDAEFSTISVDDPAALQLAYQFYRSIDTLLKSGRGAREEMKFKKACAHFSLNDEQIGKLWGIFSKWDGTPSREEHFTFMQAANKIFRDSMPQIPMAQLIETVELENTKYSKAAERTKWSDLDIGLQDEEWFWENSREAMQHMLTEAGLTGRSPESDMKVRAVIAANYAPYYEPIVQNWMFLFVSMLRKNISKRTEHTADEKKLLSAKHLDKFTAKEYYRLRLCQMEAAKLGVLSEVTGLLEKDLSSEAKVRAERMAEKFRKEYYDIANAIIDDPYNIDETKQA